MPAVDLYGGLPNGVNPDLMMPCMFAAAVSPSDGSDLGYVTRAIIVETAGNVAMVTAGGNSVTLTLPAGVFPLRVTRILSTGTTATGISAIW